MERLHDFLSLVSPGVVTEGALRRLDEYDVHGAIRSLTTTESARFLRENQDAIDGLDIPLFQITGSTTAMEVPYFQVADTLSLNKYDANNDMQLTQNQAKCHYPMGVDLAMLHGHHWDLSYPPFPRHLRLASPNLDHPIPRESIVSTNFKFAAELGLID